MGVELHRSRKALGVWRKEAATRDQIPLTLQCPHHGPDRLRAAAASHWVVEKANRRLLPEYGSLVQGPVPQLKLHSLPPVCLQHITTLGKREHKTKKETRKLAKKKKKIEVATPKIFSKLTNPSMR